MRTRIAERLLMIVIGAVMMTSCGNGDQPSPEQAQPGAKVESKQEAAIGIGPVKNIQLKAVDGQLASEGHTVFEAKCTACHKMDARHVGPALKGVTERRRPEWIMNMILNPEVMTKEDETAKKLLEEYIAPMANQNLTEAEARAILEYFRQIDAQ